MKKEDLTMEKYLKFLNHATFNDGKDIQEENRKLFDKFVTPKKFCSAQIDKFEGKNGNKTGDSLNFAAYLFAKFKGLILVCNDMDSFHYAFVYENPSDGKLYVCDPAKEKFIEQHFGASLLDFGFADPIENYVFVCFDSDGQQIEQTYKVCTQLSSNDSDSIFLRKLRENNGVIAKDMSLIDQDEIKNALCARKRENG